MKNRSFCKHLVLLAGALTALVSVSAQAQAQYPSRPVTVIVPQAAGGANDAIARIVTDRKSVV